MSGRKRSPIRYNGEDRSSSRSRSPQNRNDRSRSSSRGTFDGLDDFPPTHPDPQFNCKICRSWFHTIKELSEHEIRAHDSEIGCGQCEKKSVSVSRLAAHFKFRHPSKQVTCFYCDRDFKKTAQKMDEDDWETYRDHVYKEAVKKRMYRHGTAQGNGGGGGWNNAVALRGVGVCPHGPPVKCKNFPQCPGAKCIYSHNMCRYSRSCNKSSCPFDHPNRHRTCMSCVNDMKVQKKKKDNH